MNMIQIQDALIAKLLRSSRAMHVANAQRYAREQLESKGYTDTEARQIVLDALDMAHLEQLAHGSR